MHYPKWYPLWTNPDLAGLGDSTYGTYILFLLHQGRDIVVAANCPRLPRISVGDSFFRLLDVPADVQEELARGGADGVPLLVRSKVGIGVIDRVYGRESGLYLYTHIHGRPRRLGSLINSGVLEGLSDRDYWVNSAIREMRSGTTLRCEREYERLADEWSNVLARQRGVLRPFEDGTVYAAHLAEAIQSLSCYAGCEALVTVEMTGGKCYRPRLWEAMLLYAFCEARRTGRRYGHLHDRPGGSNDGVRVTASTVTGQDGDGLSLTVEFTVENVAAWEKERETVESIREHFRTIAQSNGMGLSVEWNRLGEMDGRCLDVRITVDCLYDPSVLESSDLKAPDGILSEEQ